MIAIDASALVAIVLNEGWADDVQSVFQENSDFCISAATLEEAHIGSRRRNVGAEMDALLAEIAAHVEPVTLGVVRAATSAHDRYGKGIHAAALNFGDCFAYALAKHRDCALLYTGDDFSKTDVKRALR